MFDVCTDLAIQSWCFRKFKPVDDLIAQIKKIGLSRVELCGVHANFNDEATFDPTIAKFKAAGITLSGMGVQTFTGEPGDEKWFIFAQKAGIKMISSSFKLESQPESILKSDFLAQKYGINLGIHNHGGADWLGSPHMLSYVLSKTSPRVGLCLDTAWMLQSGEDPLKMAEKFAPRIYGLHIKDFAFERSGKYDDVIVGTGSLPLAAIMNVALTKPPQPCACTLEYEAEPDNPAAKLIECVTAIRQAVTSLSK